jgi:hypothetical protein
MARTYPADTGALPAAHTDVTSQLADVAGPPAPSRRPAGTPLAAPTTNRVPRLKAPAQPGPTGL